MNLFPAIPVSSDLLPLVSDRQSELEVFLIHCVVVAGKSAPFGNAKTKAILADCPAGTRPFDYLRTVGDLGALFRKARTGNYHKMVACFSALLFSPLDLATCSVDQLVTIPGIGRKTASYFVMYTRPESETNGIAVIDTHVLKWCRENAWACERLRELGLAKIPISSPPSARQYQLIQQVVCEDARRKGLSSRAWDSRNWDGYSKFMDVARARALATTP